MLRAGQKGLLPQSSGVAGSRLQILSFAEAHEVLAVALPHVLRLRAVGGRCREAYSVTGWARPKVDSSSAMHALCSLWSARAALDLLNTKASNTAHEGLRCHPAAHQPAATSQAQQLTCKTRCS